MLTFFPAIRRFALAVFVLVLAALVVACGSDAVPSLAPGASQEGSIPALTGTSWIVVSVNGRSPIAGAVPTISFDATQIKGFFGCNQGGGGYRLDAATGQFAIQGIGATAMGCLQPGVTEFESAFTTALGGSTSARLDPTGQLILRGPASRIVLVTLEHPATP